MAATNVQAFSGDVEVAADLEVTGNTTSTGNFLLSDGYTQIKDRVRVLNGETLFYDPENVLSTARRTILEINANAPNSSNTAQREYTGYIELEMTAQRSVAGFNTHSGGYVGRLNFAIGYTTFPDEEWGANSFVQEIKAYDPDTSVNGLENVPRFRYKLDDATKKLQIFIEFDYQRIEASITWSVRMSCDSLDDVSIPSPTSEMSEGTLTTPPIGLAYDKVGNVGIGTVTPQYTLDVGGTLAQDGQKIYPERRWEVDLSSGTSTSNFYPLYLETDAFDANIGPYMFPVTFNVIGESLGGGDDFNEETLVGYARGGGATDHVGMCKVHSRRYEGDEFKCLGIWEGTANQLGIVIYLRGGYKYSLITNATDVVVNTSQYTNTNSTWAVKNASKTDVVGTSANINELQDVSSFVQMGEVTSFTGSLILPQNFQRLGIGTENPGAPLNIHDATSMTQSSEVLRLSRGSNGDDIRSASSGTIGMYLQDTATPYQVARLSWQHDGSDGSTEGLGRLGFWTSASSGGVPTERMTINKDGNVGIGVYPSAKLHVDGDMMIFNRWKTKTWYGGTSDNGTRYVDLITHNGSNSNSGVMVGNIEVMISRGGYAQQRAYARFHINYSYYGAAWRGHFDVLDKVLTTQISDISISLSTSPAKIRLAITSPNTGGTTGQYYVKFDGPVYVQS